LAVTIEAIPTATDDVAAPARDAGGAAGRDEGGEPPDAPGRLTLAALSVSAFLAALNFFAPTPFFPAMARDLHATVPLLGQMVTLMVFISAGLGLVVGPLAARYGYRWPLVIGILAIAANLIGVGLAPS